MIASLLSELIAIINPFLRRVAI